MNKFFAIIFAYMLSVSSAFAGNILAAETPEAMFANLIATDQGVKPAQVRIIITKGSQELAAGKQAGLRIVSLKIDTHSDNFFANVSAGYENPFEVKGKYEKIRPIPVLSHNMEKDAVITTADITYIDVSEKLLNRGYLTDETALVGKRATRSIPANKPVMPSTLANAKLVLKGNMVTATYKSDLITLQNSVVAMEDGTVGEIIKLKNVSSNKIITGKVTAQNNVELNIQNQLASN